jgi:signal transduction protein with GAF and PtsI domain
MKAKIHMLLDRFKTAKDKKTKDLLRYQIEGEVTRILSSTIDQYSEHLKDIVKTVSILMQSERVSLMVRKKNFLEISASHGLPEQALQRKSLIRLGQGIAGKVAQTGEPIFTGDLMRDEGLKESSIGGTGFKSNAFICMPLTYEDSVLGVINVSNPTEGKTYRKSDFNFLTKIASMMGMLLHKSMKIHEMQGGTRRITSSLQSVKSGTHMKVKTEDDLVTAGKPNPPPPPLTHKKG